MILHNEFTVSADIDAVWRHLLDMEEVASCLPGAEITATDEENVYDGVMRLKIGPMTVEYRGQAILRDVDPEAHTAVIALSAREARGQGTALATVSNRLEEVDGGTRVQAETDLNITGPQAQFGSGVIEDVGGRVMTEFAGRLEERIVAAESGGAAAEGSGGTTPPPAAAPDVLDVGSLVPRQALIGGAALVAGLLAVLAVLGLRRR